MPASAYGLVALFVVISGTSGWLAARVIGPRRAWAAVLPALAAFGALYLVGHRSAIRIGPEVEVLGWQVSLPFDVVVAMATALVTAGLQRIGWRLFQPQQRGARGDGLA
jgi:hypothetical protein